MLTNLRAQLTSALDFLSNSTVVDDQIIDKTVNQISLALIKADVDIHLVRQVKENIKKAVNTEELGQQRAANKRKFVQSVVVQQLYALLEPKDDKEAKDDDNKKQPKQHFQPTKGVCQVVMFVGLQGSGKTTSLCKYAHYYKSRGFKVALVCADTFRAGAYDQLKQNAEKIKVPFYGSYTERDPAVVAEAGVNAFRKGNSTASDKRDLILVDTSGRHSQDAALWVEMQEIARVVQPNHTVFVVDGAISGQILRQQATAFKGAVELGSVIITKMDGNAKGGGALTAVSATGARIRFLGNGEHMDNLEEFHPRAFVSRLLGMGDMQGIFRMLEERDVGGNSSELAKKMLKGDPGEFTFRDMWEQIKQLLQLGSGSLASMMSMMPDMSKLFTGLGIKKKPPSSSASSASNKKSNNNNNKGGDKQEDAQYQQEVSAEIEKQFKAFVCIMDSMSTGELDSSDLKLFRADPKRVQRLLKGSGRKPEEMEALFRAFPLMRNAFSSLKSLPQKAKSALENGQGDAKSMQSMMEHVTSGMNLPRKLQKHKFAQQQLGQLMKKMGSSFDPSSFGLS